MPSKFFCRSLITIFVFAYVISASASENYFDSDGTSIFFVDEGSGIPVVLVHGIYGNIDRSWKDRGVYDGLLAEGYRVIAFDNRGHGKSEKPHDSEKYGLEMPEDIRRLLDYLEIDRAHIVGYSMGGRIVTKFRELHPNRILSLTIGGNRLPYAPPPTTLDRMKKRIRERGYASEMDANALVALVNSYPKLVVEDSVLQENETATLIMVGENDRYGGRNYTEGARLLADTTADSIFVIIPGDHRGAPRSPEFLTNLLKFLNDNAPTARRD